MLSNEMESASNSFFGCESGSSSPSAKPMLLFICHHPPRKSASIGSAVLPCIRNQTHTIDSSNKCATQYRSRL